jgi:hypothetical protein
MGTISAPSIVSQSRDQDDSDALSARERERSKLSLLRASSPAAQQQSRDEQQLPQQQLQQQQSHVRSSPLRAAAAAAPQSPRTPTTLNPAPGSDATQKKCTAATAKRRPHLKSRFSFHKLALKAATFATPGIYTFSCVQHFTFFNKSA